MERNGAGQDADCQYRACPGKTRCEQKNRGNELRHPRAIAAPRLHSDLGKNVNRFRRAGEFKVKRLQEDYCCRQTANPTDYELGSGKRFHKYDDWSSWTQVPYEVFFNETKPVKPGLSAGVKVVGSEIIKSCQLA